MIVFPECLNIGCSMPVTPSTVMDLGFCPNLHAIVDPTNTGISVRLILGLDIEKCYNLEKKLRFLTV